MEYAARLPRSPSRRTLVAPLVALLVGAGVATGAYALIDDGDIATQASKVIVVEQPGSGHGRHPRQERGRHGSRDRRHASIEPRGIHRQGRGRDGARRSRTVRRHRAARLEGERDRHAAPGSAASDRAAELRSDPHGPAISLRNP